MSTSTQGRDVTEPSAFLPGHRVAATPISWWSEPDPGRDADGTLDPHLPVQVLETTTGWARVRCENDFECWVDVAHLIETHPTETHPTETQAIAAPTTEAQTTAEDAPTEVVAPTETAAVTDAGPVTATDVAADTDTTETALAPEPAETEPAETELVATTGVDAAPGRATSGRAARISIGLSLVGALLAIVGSVLPWYSVGGADVTAWDIRLVALFTREPTGVSLEVGPVLLLVALSLVAVVLRRPLPGWAALALAGVPLVLGVAGLFFYLDLPGSGSDLGIGLVATLVGAAVMLAGVTVSPRTPPRPLIRIA